MMISFFGESAMTSLKNVEVAKGSMRTEGLFKTPHSQFFLWTFFFWALALQSLQGQTDSPILPHRFSSHNVH